MQFTFNIICNRGTPFFFVTGFNCFQTPFRSKDNISNQCIVVCIQTPDRLKSPFSICRKFNINERNLPNISGEIPTRVTSHSNDCFVSTFSFTRAFFIDSHHQCHTRDIFICSCNSTDLHPRTMSHDSGENGFISEPPTSFPCLEFKKE